MRWPRSALGEGQEPFSIPWLHCLLQYNKEAVFPKLKPQMHASPGAQNVVWSGGKWDKSFVLQAPQCTQ